jgi:16S rRNA (uracil1498-N3)-methyltransferase
MQLPFFFHTNAAIGQPVTLDETTARHVLQVLRMQAGESLQLTNGEGILWTATISEVGKKNCVVRVEKEDVQERQTPRRVGVAISPTKNTSRFEWFLEKATELGVAEIFPLLTQRTERAHFRYDRMRQICISAMLQSRQVWLPVLHQPIPFSVIMKGEHGFHHRWIAHCENYEKHSLAKVLQPGMEDSLLLIGPEGDFTPEEIFTATNGGYLAVTLGNTRLRTETAGVVGAALMCLG